MSPRFLTPVEIARRIKLRGEASRSWMALIATFKGPAGSAKLISDLEILMDGGKLLRLPLKAGELANLPDKLNATGTQPALLYKFFRFKQSDWEELDLLRSGMERPGPILFLLEEKKFDDLSSYAPNIRSFLGNSIYFLRSDAAAMSHEERQARLEQLRKHFGISDAQVIERASRKELASSPSFAEWLILLDRGDLL